MKLPILSERIDLPTGCAPHVVDVVLTLSQPPAAEAADYYPNIRILKSRPPEKVIICMGRSIGKSIAIKEWIKLLPTHETTQPR